MSERDKINFFKARVGINDDNIARNYLELTNGNKEQALQLFQSEQMSNLNVRVNNNQQNAQDNQRNIEFQIMQSLFIKNVYLPSDASIYNDLNKFLNDKLIYVANNFQTFLNNLKKHAGLIIVLSRQTVIKVRSNLIRACNNQLCQDIIKNAVIFPVMSNSQIGIELEKKCAPKNYPLYLFCKYKNSQKMEIKFKVENNFLIDNVVNNLLDCFPDSDARQSLYQSINRTISDLRQSINFGNVNNFNYNNQNNNRDNNLPNNRPNNNLANNRENNNNNIANNNGVNLLRDPDNYFSGNLDDLIALISRLEENINQPNNNNVVNDHNNINNIENNNNNNINNIDYHPLPQDNNNFSQNNYNIPNSSINNINNNKNNESHNYNDNEQGYIYQSNIYNKSNNNNIYNQNENINNRINNINIPNQSINNNIPNESINNSKNFIYEPNQSINSNNNINNQSINSNINNMKNSINESKFKLKDSIYGLSAGEINMKREREMKELERQQEEKMRKEEEEKKKILAEENELKMKNEKYEKEALLCKQNLPNEPEESNSDVCRILFRYPDGEKNSERRFLKTDQINILYNYVKSLGKEIFSEPKLFNFDLFTGFPAKNLENSKNKTLEEEGLFPSSMIQIRERE